MRFVNLLAFKKLIKDIIGINYLNRRITEVVVDKATHNQLRKLENDIFTLKGAIEIISNELDSEIKIEINKELNNLLSRKYTEVNPLDKKFIFVCGLHRSGTSLFTRIMQEHKDIAGFSKTGVIQDEGQFLQTVYLPDSDLGWPGAFGYSREAHLTESSDLVTNDNRIKLYGQWESYFEEDAEYLIEKSPPNLLKTRFLQAMFPNSYFIIIRRNPIAACMATRKWNKSSMISLIRHWLKCYDIWDNDKRHISNYIEIKYEEFLDKPQEIISKVCELCGITKKDDIYQSLEAYKLSNTINSKYFAEWSGYIIQRLLVQFLFKKRILKHGYSLGE